MVERDKPPETVDASFRELGPQEQSTAPIIKVNTNSPSETKNKPFGQEDTLKKAHGVFNAAEETLGRVTQKVEGAESAVPPAIPKTPAEIRKEKEIEDELARIKRRLGRK